MALYWAACAVVASTTGYWGALAASAPAPARARLAALAATLAAQAPYWGAVAGPSAATRRLDVVAIGVFAGVNALLETAAFAAAARAGAAAASRLGPSPTLAAIASFTSLSAYCGAIHAGFWERVFPPHLPPRGSRGVRLMRVALALFVPMTASWMALMAAGDMAAVVALHWVADVSAGCALRLRGPCG